MMKRLLHIIILFGIIPFNLHAQKVIVGTNAFAIVYQPDADGHLQQIYLGKKLSDTAGYRNINASLNPAYATGGSTYLNEPALQVKHADGNMSLALVYVGSEVRNESPNVKVTDIRLKDPAYPFNVTLHYKAYQAQNIIETWTSFHHTEKQDVILNRYASAFINIPSQQNYLTHFYGEYNYEMQMHKFQLPPGIFSIQSKLGSKNGLQL
jgi:alpha-galactosidase